MNRLALAAGFGALFLAAGTADLRASGLPTPSPAHSTLPACVTACPLGDGASANFVVRDGSSTPIAGAWLVLDFCTCSTFALCAPNGSENYLVETPCRVGKFTDAAGAASFALRMGGGCMNGARVYADGVLLGTRHFATPDQNGDASVGTADATLLTGKLLGSDLSGDLNCSGTVTITDTGILTTHTAHQCTNITPVRPSSWGRLKIRYR
jgi:hypothetical protein